MMSVPSLARSIYIFVLQVELPTVLELESRPLGAAWHRR
jgi:hypothetical protein